MRKIKIKVLPVNELLERVRNDYNLANGNSKSPVTNRIIVNFIRHKLTNYDAVVSEMSKKPYKGLSKDLVYIKWLCLEEIKASYEEFFDECCAQQKNLK